MNTPDNPYRDTVMNTPDNPYRVASPYNAPGEHDPPEPEDAPQFADQSIENQRLTIRDWIRRFPCDASLIGEALNESARSETFRAAYFAGDLEQATQVMDRILREYIGAIIQRHWDDEGDTL